MVGTRRPRRGSGIGSVLCLAAALLVPLGSAAAAPATVSPAATSTTPGSYQSLTPARVLDTGTGTGAPKRPVAGHATIDVQVTGQAGVPASGVSAVVLNVTVASPTAGGHVTVFPQGTDRPVASNLNFTAGQTVPNLVVTKVGVFGQVSLYNSSYGTVRLIADVAGYYVAGAAAAPGAFAPLAPARVLDTGVGNGAPKRPVGAHRTIDVQVTGRGGVPSSGVSAVVLNVTAASPTAGGHITVYPRGTARPVASNLNFTAGQTVANLVITKIGTAGQVGLYNSSYGTTRLIADVAGYYLAGTPSTPGVFRSLAPARVLDTATGNGAPTAPVAGHATVDVQLSGRGGLPNLGVAAVVLNVTVVAPAAGGHVTVFPQGTARPDTSNLNFRAGQTVPNLVVARVGVSGAVSLYNSSYGSARLIADVAGYYLADTSPGPGPVLPTTPSMVTADALPTAQIDGVAWKQSVLGNTVYVGGDFSTARPAGAAPGVDTVRRTDLLAYDIRTGRLISSFAPRLDGQVLNLAISPDGTRLYAVGDFLTVDGAPHEHIAAFNAHNGALIPSFRAALDGSVRAVVATDHDVYVGGRFGRADGHGRGRLAAFTANGSLTAWKPIADYIVNDMVLNAAGTQVDIAGAFTNLNDIPVYGIGAVDASTGATVPFAANNTVRAFGGNSGFLSLSHSGDAVYGTAYSYHSNVGNTEGAFSADDTTGAVNWLEDCHGDTYGAFAVDSAVYVVNHAHDCQNLGGWPAYDSRHFRHTMAFSVGATGTLLHDTTGSPDHYGDPAPSIYDWFPDFAVGTFTGQNQAAWAVAGDSRYLVEGGEFPSVNGVAQQGLVRFAARPTAPGSQGPIDNGAKIDPELTNRTANAVHVAFQADWDRDDQLLRYRVVRNSNLASPVWTGTVASEWWNRPMVGFTDTGLVAGTPYTYRVYVSDPDGNTASSEKVTITPGDTTTLSGYDQQVIADGASQYWPLDEARAGVAYDYPGSDNLDEGTGVTPGTPGPIQGETASKFAGKASGLAVERAPTPALTQLTVSAWISTTTAAGGKIVGFGNNPEGLSTTYDRQLYLNNSGQVYFGVRGSGANAVLKSPNPVNDGQWHLLVGTLGVNSMTLSVDGVQVAQRSDVVPATPVYSGWWRIGGDELAGWPGAPNSDYVAARIGPVAIFPTALSAATILAEYRAR